MNANPMRKPRQGNRVRAELARRQHQEEALDDALKNTFPASDPISMNSPFRQPGLRPKMWRLEPNIVGCPFTTTGFA